jgi:hypothetical protein
MGRGDVSSPSAISAPMSDMLLRRRHCTRLLCRFVQLGCRCSWDRDWTMDRTPELATPCLFVSAAAALGMSVHSAVPCGGVSSCTVPTYSITASHCGAAGNWPSTSLAVVCMCRYHHFMTAAEADHLIELVRALQSSHPVLC